MKLLTIHEHKRLLLILEAAEVAHDEGMLQRAQHPRVGAPDQGQDAARRCFRAAAAPLRAAV